MPICNTTADIVRAIEALDVDGDISISDVAVKKNDGRDIIFVEVTSTKPLDPHLLSVFGINEGATVGLRFKSLANGHVYELAGLAPRNKKYPILAKRITTGTTYKLTLHQAVDGINAALAGERAVAD